MSIADDLHEKRPEILRIAATHHAAVVRVFGSVARGDAGPDSDVDLVVRFLPGATLFHHAAMIRELEAVLGCKVDVVSERGLRDAVRERVLREAAPV